MNDDGTTSTVSGEKRWHRSLHVAETRDGLSTVVLELTSHSARPLLLDGTAQDVWRLVDGRTVAEIVETLSAQYDVPSAEIEQPVREFLSRLLELGLVSR
ncbi:PqqD family protein [Herbiconiux ginsengi]|uniref:Coenzyme PQQ synthesis protein D (PqqD) n=1 Tax=Herbiconiux ginsengi TaxID=381665 RepID=A0A1H3U578_9MICO|nr:PqqD family protein [Herbiconiux ginsengi]SDZ57488.1 Coenzyme PQQ synthesis protein D (PqqD) [Herbiconiux ginsengi]